MAFYFGRTSVQIFFFHVLQFVEVNLEMLLDVLYVLFPCKRIASICKFLWLRDIKPSTILCLISLDERVMYDVDYTCCSYISSIISHSDSDEEILVMYYDFFFPIEGG